MKAAAKAVYANPFFRKNGWPFAILSLVAVFRGVLYLPVGHHKVLPSGLEVIVGSTPLLFGIFCLLWIMAGLIGIASTFTSDRRLAVSIISVLCGFWALGYALQYLHDWWGPGSVQPALVYFGGLTYLGFGAAVFRYPAKG